MRPLALACAGLLALLIAAPASADTIEVGIEADEYMAGVGTGCSLREAVETANADAAFGDCTETGNPSGPDTITVPPGTYTLTGAAADNLNMSGDLDVRYPTAVDEGADLTIDGAGIGSNPAVDTVLDVADLDRAFDVQSAGIGLDFAIEDLRIFNGNATDGDDMSLSDEDDGGGIRMRDENGSVTVRRAAIQNSDAARWGGAVSFDHATAGSNGPLEIIDGELIGNTATSGGAVWTGNGGFSSSAGSVTLGGATRILRSLLTENTATHRGGAIYLKGEAPTDSSGLSVLNSTIDNNTSGTGSTTGGGGAIAMGAGESRLYAHFSTITDNFSADPGTAGGIQADNTAAAQQVYLHASILAANTATGSGTAVNCLRLTGPFAPTTTAYNVESADTCGLTEGGGTDNVNESATLVDALGDNGGDTRTRLPVTNSPVLNLVPSASCIDFDAPTPVAVTDDQRGLPRPSPTGGQCDAGSVEVQASAGGSTSSQTTPTTPGQCDGKTATVSGARATISGTAGDDTINGTSGADVIAGAGGNDTINGLGGNDVICGDEGKDKLNGGGGKDRMLGGAGKDKFKGGGGKDTCIGAGGADTAATCEKEKSL